MSYIDVFQHEHCGYITGIPVYRLLESSLEEVEFIATPHQLLVGGGSGEHPAVVFAPEARPRLAADLQTGPTLHVAAAMPIGCSFLKRSSPSLVFAKAHWMIA